MNELLALAGLPQVSTAELLTALALVSARLLPIAWLAPYLAPPASPTVVRSATLAALVCVCLPLGLAHGTLVSGIVPLVLAVGRELTLGAALLVATAVPLVAVEHVGRALDAWLAPARGSEDPSGPLGRLTVALGAAIFVSIGGLRATTLELARGFVTSPIGGALTAGDARSMSMGAAQIALHAMTFAVVLAAPALVSLLAAEVGLALALRAARLGQARIEALGVRGALGIAATLFGLAAALPELPAITRWALARAAALLA